MSGTQKAVVLVGKRQIEFQDKPIPEITDPHYVKVKIEKVGICGSDVHYYTHGSIGSFVVKDPMVLGHESSGTVVEVGEKVTNVAVGDRVAIEPGVPSRYSEEIKLGKYNLCPHMEFAATPPYDGTLVKYYLSPEDFVYKLPDHVSFEEGALAEPLSVGIHANKLAKTTYGQNVVVFGAGPVGLLTGISARAYGAMNIAFLDLSDFNLDACKRLNREGNSGVFHPVNSSKFKSEDDLMNYIINLFGGDHPDITFDCSGADPCIRTAIKLLKRGGVHVQVGLGNDDITIPMSTITSNELSFFGSFRYSAGDYKDALKLISTGAVDPGVFVTRTFSFDEAIEAYKFNASREAPFIKTMIDGPK